MSLFNRNKDKSKTDKRESRRDFRLSKIKERASLLLAKAQRWKWLAVLIGLLIVGFLILKFT